MTKQQLITEDYAIYNSDCMEVIKELPNESIDLSVYSPPFAGLYNYSSSHQDFSNCESKEQFLQLSSSASSHDLTLMARRGHAEALHAGQRLA